MNPVIGSINDLLQFASETVLKPVSVASEPASGGLAELLNLEPGDDALRIRFAESFHHSSAYEYLIHLRKEI